MVGRGIDGGGAFPMMRDWFAPSEKRSSVLALAVCYSLVAVGSFGFAYLLVGPIVPFTVGAIITAVVLAPGVWGLLGRSG
jgi:hypothetical protein